MFNFFLLFAQKKTPSPNVNWGASEIVSVLAVVVVGLFLYSGILKLLKMFFPEKFYVHLDPKIEAAILTPSVAEVPEEVLNLLKAVNQSIQNKENAKRQEEMLGKIKQLYEWHKPEEKFGTPDWYCVCAMSKIAPDWDGILRKVEKIDKDSDGIKGVVSDLKKAHKEWSESVVATNQQMSQAMTSLISYLSAMERGKNEDRQKGT